MQKTITWTQRIKGIFLACVWGGAASLTLVYASVYIADAKFVTGLLFGLENTLQEIDATPELFFITLFVAVLLWGVMLLFLPTVFGALLGHFLARSRPHFYAFATVVSYAVGLAFLLAMKGTWPVGGLSLSYLIIHLLPPALAGYVYWRFGARPT